MKDLIDQFLMNPRNHSDSQQDIELVETHISKVYLGRDEVFKRKKQLKLPFLDYQSLENRYQACLDEINLNRRLAPQTYLGILALYDTPSGIAWQASSELDPVIDWLVHMQRLPQEQMLDQRLRRELPPEPVEQARLVNILADFYQQQRLGSENVDLVADKWLLNLWQHCHQNMEELKSIFPDNEERIQKIESRQKDWLFFHEKWFLDRLKQGLICDGHGDLKPEHICMIVPPVIYDCVEFDKTYRTNDILDELSFLALECEFLGYADLGTSILKNVIARFSNDLAGGSFYRSYRACVRSKIEALKARSSFNTSHTTKQHERAAQGYFELADYYADRLDSPQLLIIGGLMGSGKTSLARALSQILGAAHLESDRVRQEVFPDAHDEHVSFGTGLYQVESRQEVYRRLARQCQDILQRGQTVIVDASFTSRENRLLFQKLAKDLDTPFHSLWCNCPPQLAKARISQRRKAERTASHARTDLYDQQQAGLDPFEPDEGPIILDTSREIQDSLKNFQMLSQAASTS